MKPNHRSELNAGLEASELECLRGFQSLFEGLSFAVSPGEALQVTGANGSGKTSLLRILCGLGLAESGEVRWNGVPIARAGAEYRAVLGYLGHRPALKGELTPRENLRAHTTLHGKAADDTRILSVLESFGIGRRHDRPCRTLSAGQQQRTALARIVLGDTPLWILDEPATALDDGGIACLEAAMDDRLARGGVIVFTSHQSLEGIRSLGQLALPGNRG